MTTFTIGADPEFFLRAPDGHLVSSIGKIGGSKTRPKLISKDGHAILEDNVAVEFNIPPCSNPDDFVHHLTFVMDHLKSMTGKMGLEFAEGVASASFPLTELACPQAFVFGCEPDFNAWTMTENPPPKSTDPTLRSCGGHVHIGTDLDIIEVVRACDVFMGVYSVFKDNDSRRRELYGKPGAHRKKPYGVEYRTLSNFWIWSDEGMRWVYEQTAKALNFVAGGGRVQEKDQHTIYEAIVGGDKHAAENIMRAYAVA